MNFIIPGHCYSLKNHRPIMRRGRRGKPFLGKSVALRRYQAAAVEEMKAQWKGLKTICEPVGIALEVCFFGVEPDALGPAETIFDCLQLAEVVEDDRLLVPLWIERIKSDVKGLEYVEISLLKLGVHHDYQSKQSLFVPERLAGAVEAAVAPDPQNLFS